ncbi:fHA domain protein [Prevotella sp. CAG:755]|nr:fHA domain protein [Prevotella sp. CAG:755]
MKRIRCPKCDEPITFDDKLYAPGRILVFECPACRKEFKIRIAGGNIPKEPDEAEKPLASVTVIENAFHFKQVIPLRTGENVIGRHVNGTKANAAIKTVDPSVDTTHCIITLKADRNGSPVATLRDGPSNTGTFWHDHLLGLKESVRLTDGDIITLGATTLIFNQPYEQET